MSSAYSRVFPLLGFLAFLWSVVVPATDAEIFRYSYRSGEKYKVVSTVEEDVYVNGVHLLSSDILNKISVEVRNATETAGRHIAVFQTSEKAYQGSSVYTWSEEYTSEFWRDQFGRYTIDSRYFMPVVRNVPVFPAEEIAPGHEWTAEGEEVHDFRANFGMEEPFRFPISVEYAYIGKAELEGNEYDLLTATYQVTYQVPGAGFSAFQYPIGVKGYSDQLIYWDQEAGKPYAYREEFDFIFVMTTGDRYEFAGYAEARITESPPLDREKVAADIRRHFSEEGVEDADVSATEKGVTITLSDIRFAPDSSRILNSERPKLQQLGDILARYPNRDILIEGHTALAGTAEGRRQLSIERAGFVAEYLLENGIREEEQITIRGYGAERPVAENTTEEGMQLNRRVEITILEN